MKHISTDPTSTISEINEMVIYLRPSRGWAALNLLELWRFRELILFLTWRDILVRFKQTVFGASWAVIQPLFTMVVFTFFFGRLAKVPTDGIPYPIFSFTALLPWGLFSKALGDAGRSLVQQRAMITKVYFPRLAIPIASVLGGVVDFAISFIVLILMIVYYNIIPTSPYHVTMTSNVLFLPFFLLLCICAALGVGLWLSALNVIYRDINHMIPFLTQILLFITPIAYSSQMIPEKWQFIYALNPMVGVVEGFRWALLGSGDPPSYLILISVMVTLVLLVSGLFYFRRMERTFADMV
ncbi:MAG: phosphate ABC transporter permease [Chloroflexi bacterium RBG_16_54_18]|nr:MAG: phosphate ABC transporter permease [Chloroflexi bacterium RBG_16_54_18]